MKRLHILLFIMAMFLTTVGFCSTATAAEYSLSVEGMNKHILPGSGAVAYEDAVLQTNLSAKFANGIYANIWGSAGLRGRDNSLGGDEMDFTIGWSTVAKGLNLDLGVTYLNYIDLSDRSVVSDAIMPYLEVSKDYKLTSTQTLAPYVRHEQIFVANGNGSYSYLGARHTWSPEMMKRLSLNSNIAIVYNSRAYGSEDGFVATYTGNANWKLTDKLSVNLPIVKVGAPLDGISDRNTNASVGAGIAYNF